MKVVEESVGRQQYLTFFIAEEEYAVGVLQVKEIIEFDLLTRVPRMPATVRGVINLRGTVVPVIDLAIKFGLSESRITKRTCIVVLEKDVDGETSLTGIMVDTVGQVISLGSQEIELPPAFGTRLSSDYLQGLAKSGKKFALILDTDRLLSIEEMLSAGAFQPSEAAILANKRLSATE